MHGDTAVLFPPHVTHADMVKAFPDATLLGAGFVRFDETTRKLFCYGKSSSLGVESREEDNFFVNKLVEPLF
jgi:hypothetical protein